MPARPPPLRKKLLDLYHSWQWIFVVAGDNLCRRHLGFSPLLRRWLRRRHPWHPSHILRHRNLCLRGDLVDDSLLGSQENIEYHPDTHLWLPFASSNLALSMRSALAIHHCMSQLKLEAKNTGLLLKGHSGGKLQQLLSYFASARSVKSLRNQNHRFAELIEPKPLPDPKWIMSDRGLAEDFRLHVLQGVGIRAAPPCTGVRRVSLISRQPYPERPARNPFFRIIDNEEELLEGLRAQFPHMQINRVRFELHSVEEQLALVNETDALIGMHGAGMGYATLLPANAAVLEMLPCHFRKSHYFSTFYIVSAARGLHYRRWVQLLPWRERTSESYAALRAAKPDQPKEEPSKDLTTVPVRAIASRLRALERDVAAGSQKLAAGAKPRPKTPGQN